MDYVLLNNDGKETLDCSNCSGIIAPGNQYAKTNDGILCLGCFDWAFPKCEFCGKRLYEDDMLSWGDCNCCPDCYEGFNPSFNEEENERETTNAYEEMVKKYIGKKSCIYQSESVELKYETSDCGLVVYKLQVDIDEEGIIYEISRLTAEILLSESEKSSSWGSYIIRNEDYTDKVDDMMLNLDLE